MAVPSASALEDPPRHPVSGDRRGGPRPDDEKRVDDVVAHIHPLAGGPRAQAVAAELGPDAGLGDEVDPPAVLP